MIGVTEASDTYIDTRVTQRQEYHVRGRVMDATTGRPPDTIQFATSLRRVVGMDLAIPAPVRSYDPVTGDFDLAGMAPGTYMLEVRNRSGDPFAGLAPRARLPTRLHSLWVRP